MPWYRSCVVTMDGDWTHSTSEKSLSSDRSYRSILHETEIAVSIMLASSHVLAQLEPSQNLTSLDINALQTGVDDCRRAKV